MKKLLFISIAFFLFGGISHAGTAYVKGCTGSNGPVSSITCAFTGNVTNGDIIACMGAWDTSRTFTSFSKTSGTSTVSSFTQPNTVLTSGTNGAQQGYATVSATGTATITLSVGGGTATVNVICHDISGGNTTTPLDVSTQQNQSSSLSGANAVTSGTVTTTVNGDYLFGWCWDIGGNASSIAAGTGFTIRDQISVGGRTTESEVQSTAGSGTAATFTTTGGTSDTWQNGVMAFQVAAAVTAHTAIPVVY